MSSQVLVLLRRTGPFKITDFEPIENSDRSVPKGGLRLSRITRNICEHYNHLVKCNAENLPTGYHMVTLAKRCRKMVLYDGDDCYNFLSDYIRTDVEYGSVNMIDFEALAEDVDILYYTGFPINKGDNPVTRCFAPWGLDTYLILNPVAIEHIGQYAEIEDYTESKKDLNNIMFRRLNLFGEIEGLGTCCVICTMTFDVGDGEFYNASDSTKHFVCDNCKSRMKMTPKGPIKDPAKF